MNDKNLKALKFKATSAGQHGFVLVLSLVILLLLSIVVLSVNSSIIAQEKMIASTKQANLALEAAENALRMAEISLKNTAASNLDDLVDQLKISESGEISGSYFDDATWTTNDDFVKTFDSLDAGNTGVRARYFIEKATIVVGDGVFLSDENSNNVGSLVPTTQGFRIIARGEFVSGDKRLAQRVLVSHYARLL